MTSAIAAIALMTMGGPTPQTKLERYEEKIPGSLVTLKQVKIPAGEITIGDKTVAVKSIWVSETEITWDLYDIYAFRLDLTQQQQAAGVDAEARPSKPYGAPDHGFGHQGYAALGPTANAAQKFCEWLSKKTGKTYRLPTEAEWEYAARAGATSDPAKLDDVAWYWDNSADEAQPVGKKKPNEWGLFDMLGNVLEWTIDLKGVPVTCGGSWNSKANEVSYKARKYYDPKWQEEDAHVPKSKWWLSNGEMVGFRVVREQ